jgi:hypothetical protein
MPKQKFYTIRVDPKKAGVKRNDQKRTAGREEKNSRENIAKTVDKKRRL